MDIRLKVDALRRFSGFEFDSDIFVGMLLAITGKQHLILTVSRDAYLDFAQQMTLLIGSNIFGFFTVSLNCTAATTTDEFASMLLGSAKPSLASQLSPALDPNMVPPRPSNKPLAQSGKLPNLVVIRNLDKSSNYVQAQLLEILRSKKMTTASGVYMAPSPFVVIPVLSKTNMRLNLFPYLLDHFFMSHDYEPPNSDESHIVFGQWTPPIELPSPKQTALFNEKEIDLLQKLSSSVVINVDIRRNIHDIIVFLRMHRAVSGGVSARASRDFELLVRCLCPLHGISFATPSIVAIAARKTYSHRISITDPELERSVLYGSDVEAVKRFLQQWTGEAVLEDILDTVPAPICQTTAFRSFLSFALARNLCSHSTDAAS
ncbi:uncharacterized protein V1518DRAFT_410048 [Limtongia smithiae]|uniref:uncharacterized protein n=1 Tax=Limtongia smithiae TaxID=1125753 RepID=UPI0034D01D46